MKKSILVIGLLISILFTSIVYSSFNTNLQVSGEAVVRSIQNIRIDDVRLTNHTGTSYEKYNSKYTKDTTSLFVVLPANTSMTYEVDITNKNSGDYIIESIEELSNTNSNIIITKTLNINDIINGNNVKTFTITLTNNTETTQEETLVYKYVFRENLFIVTFDANGGSVSQSSKQVSYGSEYGALPTPTREGYTFKGWSLLPSEYQQVEYIESTGTQYIDLNYYDLGGIVSDFSVAYTGSTAAGYIVGSHNKFEPYGRNGGYYNWDGHAWELGYGDNFLKYSSSLTFNQIYDVKFSTIVGDGYLEVDGNRIITDPSIQMISNENLYIFSNTYKLYQNTASSKAKLYYAKIYVSNNSMIKNLIPCYRISDGEAGLYDTVKGIFYTNTGTGTFEKGNNVNIDDDLIVTNSTIVNTAANHTLTAIWEANTYTVTFDENFDYFEPASDLTLTNFDGTSNYCLALGIFRTDELNIGDLLVFEADIEYTDLVANGGGVAVQGRGNVAGWSGQNYNSKYYYISGTGTQKITYSFYTSNTDFKDNAFYRFQLRTNNYTSGTLTISSIKVTRINSTREVVYDSNYGTLPTISNGDFVFTGWTLNGNDITSTSKVKTAANHTLKAMWGTELTNNKVDYDYTGTSVKFIAPYTGSYKIELWGAQGGAQYSNYIEELGGYTSGIINLKRNERLYVYVGEKGKTSTYYDNAGSYNGGGEAYFDDTRAAGGLGGGATDVRLLSGEWDNFDSLKSRIMVAGAAGGTGYSGGTVGGAGGGLNGHDAIKVTSSNWINAVRYGLGGTQTSPGEWGNASYTSNRTEYLHLGGFGYGGNSVGSYDGGGSGGGGYYGGAGGIVASGGGGSSFISGYSGCNAISRSSTENNITHTGGPNHYSGKVFTSGVMIDGAGCNWSSGAASNCGTNQPQPDGTTATGHSGNGYARITFIG